MKYNKFKIENYRAIKGPLEININKNRLLPLIGANECGKTTILQAIFSFDYANDQENNGKHLIDTNNLYEPKNQNAPIITAFVSINKKDFLNVLNDDLLTKYQNIDNFSEIEISRNLDTKKYNISIICDENDANIIAESIVRRLPYIIYNDDFIERPKNIIDIPETKENLFGWIGIYERAFNIAGYSIFDVIKNKNDNVLASSLSDVEQEINTTLVKEWSKLSIDNGNCLSIKINIKDSKLEIKIMEKIGKTNRYFNIEDRSKGFLWFFNFVMKIKYNPKSTGSSNDIIYLLDEPGSYLHSVAQERLCKMIQKISNKDGTVIYCTHTHHLLDPKHIPTKYIYLVQKNKQKNIQLKRIYEVKTLTKKETELQPVYEALGLADWDYFTQTQKIIAVEGIHDKYAIDLILGDKLDGYVVFPCVNAESIYNNLSKFIAYGKEYVAIWDNDDEGNNYYEKAKLNFGKLEEKHMLVLPNLYNLKKVRMEELFFKNDLEKIAINLGMPQNSSYSNILLSLKCEDEKVVKDCLNKLSQETKTNFEQLYNMIENSFINSKSAKKEKELQYN